SRGERAGVIAAPVPQESAAAAGAGLDVPGVATGPAAATAIPAESGPVAADGLIVGERDVAERDGAAVDQHAATQARAAAAAVRAVAALGQAVGDGQVIDAEYGVVRHEEHADDVVPTDGEVGRGVAVDGQSCRVGDWPHHLAERDGGAGRKAED